MDLFPSTFEPSKTLMKPILSISLFTGTMMRATEVKHLAVVIREWGVGEGQSLAVCLEPTSYAVQL